MAKDDVYSWRLSRARKSALEEAARAEQTTVSELLERATDEWIHARTTRVGSDDVEQRRLRAGAARFIGVLHGGDPDRARQARVRLRAKLTRRRHGS
jgi:hypothetical protein